MADLFGQKTPTLQIPTPQQAMPDPTQPPPPPGMPGMAPQQGMGVPPGMGSQPMMTPGAGMQQPLGFPTPQPSFGQGLTNLLTNPLVGTALTGYLGAIGAPRRSGLGGALSRGGLMAMMNLPNLTSAQAQQALLPGQLAQQQAQVAQQQLATQGALQRQNVINSLSQDPSQVGKLSAYQLANLGPQTAGPLLAQYHEQEGTVANQRNAMVMTALAQSDQYAGTPAGNWMLANAATLANAPDYVDPDKLFTSLSKHDLDQADIVLRGGQAEEAHAQATIGIPATAASAMATAGKTGIETQLAPEEAATRRIAAEAEATKAQAEYQKELPGGSSAQQRINAVVSQYERSNVMPRLLSMRPDTAQQFGDTEYQDLRRVGADHEVAINKVRQLVPGYQGPQGPLPGVGGGGMPGAGIGAPPSQAPSAASQPPPAAAQSIPQLPQGGTHYAVGQNGQILGWAGPDGQVHPF
jgi:hypothetical protein